LLRVPHMDGCERDRERQGRLGGGEGIVGLYGSVTRTGMQRVLDCLAAHCGLGASSNLVDVGAGLGRRGLGPARPCPSHRRPLHAPSGRPGLGRHGEDQELCCLPVASVLLQGGEQLWSKPRSGARACDVSAGGARRPLLHALVSPGVAGGWGMEVDRIKCDKAAAFLAQAAAALLRRGAVTAALPVPLVRCAPVEQARGPSRAMKHMGAPSALISCRSHGQRLALRPASDGRASARSAQQGYRNALARSALRAAGRIAGARDARVLVLGGHPGGRQARLRPPVRRGAGAPRRGCGAARDARPRARRGDGRAGLRAAGAGRLLRRQHVGRAGPLGPRRAGARGPAEPPPASDSSGLRMPARLARSSPTAAFCV